MAVNWTEEQLTAINRNSGDGNILVCAAAGSGKTAVLVERIINKVTSGETDIDKMLVVTFTEAAASEMRDKIIKRMYAAYADSKGADKERLRAQIKAAQSADILTIDSFCLRVLRNNFYVLGIDPNFRIADNSESELIAEEAVEALFNRLYNADTESGDGKKFYHLLNVYASNRNDEKLRNIVKGIYNFTQSFANPLEWLKEKSGMYSDDMAKSIWMREYVPKLYIRQQGLRFYFLFYYLIKEMAADLTGIDIEDIYSVYDELAEAYGEMARTLYLLTEASDALVKAKEWNDANRVYKKYIASDVLDKLTRVNRPKDITADIEDWKYYCGIRNEFKKEFIEFMNTFKNDDEDLSVMLHSGDVTSLVRELAWLTEEFLREIDRAKDLRNVKGFSDIEHLVCRLFLENEDIRNEYRDKYDEILIDEYQDTNGLQDTIFESISRDRKNIFMVGDLKQSIYRFRGGDPTIFKGKSKLYTYAENSHSRIDLSQNFRSRQEILKSVNHIFKPIMSERVGDVEYKKEQAVRHFDKDVWDDDYKSEAHFIAYSADESADEEITGCGIEAEFIADRIEELIKSGFRIDDNGVKRPLRLGDITILTRSVKGGIGETFVDRLKKRGIASNVETEDYFTRREIQLMVSVLAVVDNRLQDIPLAAVMKSPVGNFTDNDMAMIRILTPSGCLYDAIKSYSEKGGSDELKYKCDSLIQSLKRWRNEVKRKSVANLIWTIYEETGFYDFMGALEGGDEAQGNLRLLYERARQYEQSGFKGLFNFIRYINRIRERGNDLSSAAAIGYLRDTVRIMTMHKSKGLEFPVVFLAGMGRKFNHTSPVQGVYIHKDLGFGACYVSEKKHYIKDTIFSRLVKEQNRREDISEEMRLLYVAMTRAKEKLITVASRQIKPTERRDFEMIFSDTLAGWKRYKVPEDAMCYADWIFPAVMKDNGIWDFYTHKKEGFSYTVNEEEEEEEAERETVEVSDELREVIDKNFSYSYSYPHSGYIPAKTSVTALKQKQNDVLDLENADRKYEYDPIYMDDLPEFMRSVKRGSEVGTAHHQVMAYIDLDGVRNSSYQDLEEFVESEILRIASLGEIEEYYYENEKMRKSIALHIADFFKSPIGKAALGAEKIYREQPFQIEIGADEYDNSLEEKYNSEKVILQGVIDCYFETEDGVVLLDYKTDHCNSEKDIREIADKYAVQLDLYQRAIEKITGKRVREKYLYLFAVNREVKL